MSGKEFRETLRAWLDLLSVSSAFKKAIDTAFRRDFGLSISRFDVLSALDRAGREGLRAGDLSQRLLVTEGNVTQVTAPLIRDGLIKRAPCTEDRRAAVFTLTRKGEKLFAKMAEAHQAWVGEAFANLSPNQISSLRRLLGKIETPSLDRLDGRNAA